MSRSLQSSGSRVGNSSHVGVLWLFHSSGRMLILAWPSMMEHLANRKFHVFALVRDERIHLISLSCRQRRASELKRFELRGQP